MNEQKRRHAATATLGLGGVAASGALAHSALVDAYGERTATPTKRPRFGAERRFIRHSRGRGKYLTGTALGLVSIPPAAMGTSGLLERRKRVHKRERRSFIREGFTGAREAVSERNKSALERPPAKLVAGNYLAGAAIGAGAGGLVHRSLEARRFPGATRSGLARTAGVLAGVATLPAQRKMTERASRGAYTVTPTGVRRRKEKPTRPSSKAEFHHGGSTGRVTKRADDPGANLTRGQRRALVTASGVPVPVVGDVMQASTAARLSPKKYRRRTAAQNYAGGQAGGLAGNLAGAAGAVALANSRPGFQQRAAAASDRIDRVKAATRQRARIPAAGAPLTERVLSSPRTPERARRATRAVASTRLARHIASNPKVAAVGAIAGGTIGGQMGQQATYSRIMTRDDRYRRKAETRSRKGTARRVQKADAPRQLSQREQKQLANRKRRSAMMSYVTGTTGLGALTALGVSRVHPKLRRVKNAQTPLLTIGAGVGGVGSFNYANIQRKEAQAKVGKAMPRIVFRRAPAVRRGFLRQTRTRTGIKVSTVRGGLMR